MLLHLQFRRERGGKNGAADGDGFMSVACKPSLTASSGIASSAAIWLYTMRNRYHGINLPRNLYLGFRMKVCFEKH